MANNKIQVMGNIYPVTVIDAVKVGDGSSDTLADRLEQIEYNSSPGGAISTSIGVAYDNLAITVSDGIQTLEILSPESSASVIKDCLVYYTGSIWVNIYDLTKKYNITFDKLKTISGIKTKKNINGNTAVVIPNNYAITVAHSNGAVSLKAITDINTNNELVYIMNCNCKISGHLYESYVGYHVNDYTFTNDCNPIFTRGTKGGTNEGTHPSVLYFENGWNGYKFWMAQTEYPITRKKPSRDYYEDPYIYCSNDGVDFDFPDGMVEPLAKAKSTSGFHSDPHLVYRSDLNRIECWYRYTDFKNVGDSSTTTWLLRKYSTDGINWSEEEELVDMSVENSTIGQMIRSHSVSWDNTNSKYRIWFTDGAAGTSKLCYSEVTNPLDISSYSVKQYCNLDCYTECWHDDVFIDGDTYYLVNYINRSNVYLYTSIDGINFNFVKTLISIKDGLTSGYFNKLYRTCILKASNTWLVYFTGETLDRASIFLLAGTDLGKLQMINGNAHNRREIFQKGLEIVNTNYVQNKLRLTDKGTYLGVDYETERVFIEKSDGTKIYLNE